MEINSENATIRFRLQTVHNTFSESHEVYVSGNIDALGNWNPKEGVRMTLSAADLLEATIKIPKNINNIVEYKYVNITTNDGQVHWEHGENRRIHKIDSEYLQIQDQYRVST